MLQRISGFFNGTGAALYLCVGAVPRSVRLIDLEVSTNPNIIEWDQAMMGGYLAYEGIYITGSSGAITKLVVGAGVRPYEGGDDMTSTNQTTSSYGEGVYLEWDLADYRQDYVYGSGTSGTPINKWTLGSSASRTGNWNVAKVASGSRIGVGSIVRIRESNSGIVKEASIVAITSDGEAANEVTLSRSIASGDITFIGGYYQMIPVALGKVAKAGVYVADVAVNVNDDTISFEMEIDNTLP